MRNLFENYTDEARRCVVLGQEEAWILKADAVGTEHLLLGLVQEGNELIAEALKAAGFAERAARLSRAKPPEVHIPLTEETRQALERSEEESAALGDTQVLPGHLLLALLREDDGSAPRGSGAFRMLQEQGIDVGWLRDRVTRLLQNHCK